MARPAIEWDRSRTWEVHAVYVNRLHLSVAFAEGGPELRDLVALRKLVDAYRLLRPAELKAQVSGRKLLDIGVYGSMEGHRLIAQARHVGLALVAKDASYTSYSFVDVTEPEARHALVVENGEDAERLAQEMIAFGCKVVAIEAC